MAPTVPPQEVLSSSRRWHFGPAVVLTLVASLSCAGDETIPPDPPEPAQVTVSPSSLEFAALSDTARLSAQVHDQYGDLMADAAVTWGSSDASVASVDSDGLVRSVGNGEAMVVAKAGSASDSATAAFSLAPSRMPRIRLFPQRRHQAPPAHGDPQTERRRGTRLGSPGHPAAAPPVPSAVHPPPRPPGRLTDDLLTPTVSAISPNRLTVCPCADSAH